MRLSCPLDYFATYSRTSNHDVVRIQLKDPRNCLNIPGILGFLVAYFDVNHETTT